MLLESYCRKEYRAGAPPCVRRGHACLPGLVWQQKRSVCLVGLLSHTLLFRIGYAGVSCLLAVRLLLSGCFVVGLERRPVTAFHFFVASCFVAAALTPVFVPAPVSACRHPGGRTPRVYGAASAQRRPLRSALAQRRLFAPLLFAQGQCSRTLLALPEEAFQSFY